MQAFVALPRQSKAFQQHIKSLDILDLAEEQQDSLVCCKAEVFSCDIPTRRWRQVFQVVAVQHDINFSVRDA